MAGVYAEAAEGRLPVIAADGRMPRSVYAMSFAAAAGKNRITLVILDAGLSQTATEAAIYRLPGTVALAFSVYTRDLQQWVDRARRGGHEVLITVPFRVLPTGHSDLGPLAVPADLAAPEGTQRVRRILGAAVGYVGVVGDLTRTFSASPEVLTALIEEFDGRGLLYLDAGAAATGRPPGSPSGAGRFLEVTAAASADAGPAEMDAVFVALEAAATRGEHAVGLAFPTPLALERIAAWAATLGDRSLTLAPVSAAFPSEFH